MRGMEPLLAMRKKGNKPTGTVTVRLGNGNPAWHRYKETWGHPEIFIEPGDIIPALDMRPLVGLHVLLVDGDYSERFNAVAERIKTATPASLIALFTAVGDGVEGYVWQNNQTRSI